MKRASHHISHIVRDTGFHLSFVWTSAMSLRLSAYDHFMREFGRDTTVLLMTVAIVAATLIGPRLRPFWASGPINVFWAASVTSLLASGTALAFTQTVRILVFGDPLLSFLSLPVTFAAAAFLVPIELISHPMAALAWGMGSMLTAVLARLSLRPGHRGPPSPPRLNARRPLPFARARHGSAG